MRRSSTAWILPGLLLLGLGLRLMVWRWHEFYPLGGDETEYFNQALTWLQGKGYHELQFMRPPLYTVFLAVVFQLFDSQVQRVRLVQALVSTGTIGLIWLWSRELWFNSQRRDRIALTAAALAALSYTFAANATELLTETLFVAGLTLAFWLILVTARLRSWRWALAAGLAIGLLSLLRSVGLPLVPLAALWLLLQNQGTSEQKNKRTKRGLASLFLCLFVPLLLGSALVIAPWTLRNYLRYDTPIIVDTTGAENLWLDNDPAGREAVKRQLYALGDDRGTRQQLGMAHGLAVITADPGRFLAKAWGEAKKFVALEYFDDLRSRPEIWVPPPEVWLRLLLGDGLWLLLLFGGIAGLWLSPGGMTKLLIVPWALYVFLTGLLFHVELRYRLPIYPALLPYAAWLVAAGWDWRRSWRGWRAAGALATAAVALALVLLHRSYLSEGTRLARKHLHLWQAAQAREQGDLDQARQQAQAALTLDPDSALARVQLGLAAPPDQTQRWWQAAIDVLPAHPYAHLLLGNQLRAQGDLDAARRELAFEANSLEDLQRWSLRTFDRAAEKRIDVGDGLDLGLIGGFYLAQEDDDARWTRERAAVHRLALGSFIHLRLASPRPPAADPAIVQVALDGVTLDSIEVGGDWQTFTLAVPESLQGRVSTLTLTTTTFRPRAYDRASPDNRELGVQVDWIATTGTATAP
ncbi:MAG: glycosyltransferase family 39 protein [Chloroflexi bacterium]|nr:glycosyltransferase family 39 protein [Chloroflexota bacterium]